MQTLHTRAFEWIGIQNVNSVVQRQTWVTAYYLSKQLLLFAIEAQSWYGYGQHVSCLTIV